MLVPRHQGSSLAFARHALRRRSCHRPCVAVGVNERAVVGAPRVPYDEPMRGAPKIAEQRAERQEGHRDTRQAIGQGRVRAFQLSAHRVQDVCR